MMMKFLATLAQGLIAATLMVHASSAAAQQTYPSKPIRFIVPYPPGGSNNLLARLLGQQLSENWGQPVVVDNRPGGNAIIGSEALVRSSPDGYTLLLINVTHPINAILMPTPYDAIKDFAPVATLVSTEYILALNASLPANNLREFIALAKSKPGQLNCASVASGGLQHLALELFNILAGVKIQHVPYKGGGPALIDLIGGQVQLTFNNSITLTPHIKSGKVKAIAIGGETRLPTLPQVPTFTEAGLPGFNAKNWFGVAAPAGTPREIISKLSTEIAKILVTPDFKEKLASQGVVPFLSTPDQLAALIKADMVKYAKIIKTANIKFE